jgi:hypothetical protein
MRFANCEKAMRGVDNVLLAVSLLCGIERRRGVVLGNQQQRRSDAF